MEDGLATILLVCAIFVLIVDVAAEFGDRLALRLKWGYPWIIFRYIAIVTAILLALEVKYG